MSWKCSWSSLAQFAKMFLLSLCWYSTEHILELLSLIPSHFCITCRVLKSMSKAIEASQPANHQQPEPVAKSMSKAPGASQRASHYPASQPPASHPASQPSSQPATQPASQPVILSHVSKILGFELPTNLTIMIFILYCMLLYLLYFCILSKGLLFCEK